LVEKDVNNNEKISDILEKTYGEGCRNFEEHPTENEDVVRIYINKKESQKNGCEHYVMDSAEYNKRLQKLVLWNLGSSFCYFKTEAECSLFYRANKFVEDK
jgi:hypothetical protein